MTPLERITERVSRAGDVNDPETPRPLLTLEEFFDGNEVAGSIACNLTPTPMPAEIHAMLHKIEVRRDVAEVRVEITMFDDPDWPFSDTVWVITSAEPQEVERWFPEELRPDECFVGWTDGVAYEPLNVPAGMRPVACWWD